MPSEKKGSAYTKAVFGGCFLIVALMSMFMLRYMGVGFPFLFSRTQAAPEGTAVTIHLLAWCRDNSTEVIAVREFSIGQMQLVSASGKDIKLFAVTATFLTGPPRGELLQALSLTYELSFKTARGEITKLKKTVAVPIIGGLGLHQTAVTTLTPEQMGLVNVGDASLLTVNVNVQADMLTDKQRTVASSTGLVEARMTMQEGGFMRAVTSGQVSKEGHGYIVAQLSGTMSKPQWKVQGVVRIASSSGKEWSILDEPDAPPEAVPKDKTPSPSPSPKPEPPPPTSPPTWESGYGAREPEPPPDGGRMFEPTFGETCFLSETLVLTCTGEKRISDLLIGERVLGVADGRVLEGVVSQIFKHNADSYYLIQTGKREVRVTESHLFLTRSGWTTAGNLAVGDSVVVLRNGQLCEEQIAEKKLVTGKVTVFNIRVSGTETYFAGGFAVHNKLTMSLIDLLRSFFNGYMLVLPIRVTNSLVIDGAMIIILLVGIALVCLGMILSRNKK